MSNRIAARLENATAPLPLLEKVLSIPCNGGLATGMLTPALLRLDPMFDQRRNDPRFQKLCEEKPK
jgi:hypothetical protein